ncbi:RAC-beta serine/threonine-protein kinase [Takifugu flavidus]|uniref:RAC-beta serine/threonine-protein kinase n=1 Tax=Takifugu flavidus TaxID=433684 RepID=A0A5C6P396_9TELE|nr:RAC-beta serine/threonine-protein kinase [Takifugu flavidus]
MQPVDVNYLLICEERLIMCSLQDEVAHTVTESRVLQNTRHPFLTLWRRFAHEYSICDNSLDSEDPGQPAHFPQFSYSASIRE